jgi:hypothetical protein
MSAIFVGGTGRYDVHVTLPSLVPFGPLVSEEKIKMSKKLTDGRRTPGDGNTSHGHLGQVS